ncbi:flippase [Leuconostoc mesenteroides]|uniref:flippase n=1 Tax=Leuconostoc mesenteroides TaxID=1245 RepID=UPI0032DE8296
MIVVKNYIYNVLYQLLSIMVPLLTMSYLSRTLGPSGLGTFSWTTSVANYFVLLATMGITLYGNREIAYSLNSNNQSKKFYEIQILHFIIGFITLLVYFIFIILFSTINPTFHTNFLGLLIQGLLVTSAIFDISWYFMGREEFKKTVIRNTLVRVINVILIFAIVKAHTDTNKYIFLVAMTQLLGNLSMWLYLPKTLEKVEIKTLRIYKHFKATLTLFLPTIAIQVYMQLNKTMLPLFHNGDTSLAGYYDNADKILKIILAVLTATGTVMLPRMSNAVAHGNMDVVKKSVYNTMQFVTSLAFPMMFGLIAISPGMISWFLGSNFSQVATILQILTPILIFISWSNVLGLQFLMPTNQVKSYTISVTLGALLNIILNFLFIPDYGVQGAAVATVLSEALVTGYQLWAVKESLPIHYIFYGFWKYALSGVMMLVSIIMTEYYLIDSSTIIGTFILTMIGALIYIVCIYLLKSEVVLLLRKILKTKRRKANSRRKM